MELCALRQIRVTYGKELVLRGVDLSLPAGGILGLIGENGSGKSTLLRVLAGVQRPTGGELITGGQRPRVGYMPENCRWYPDMTGAQVLSYFARLRRIASGAAAELLQQVGLWPARDKKVGAYSKGMKQKLGLAQALMGDPELLILDEPTNGLDPRGIAHFYEILAERAAAGVGVVLSSHLLAEIEAHVTHVAFLRGGVIVRAGAAAELLAAADLPSSITLRGAADPELVGGLLDSSGWVVRSCCRGLRVEVPRAEAASLLQALAPLDLEGVDIDVRHAGLEDLYLDALGGEGADVRRSCPAVGVEEARS